MTRPIWQSTSRRIVTREEMAAWENIACQQLQMDTSQLMEFAGLAFVHCLTQQQNVQVPLLILCGTGNNGGDGLVIARHLHMAGYEVQVAIWGSLDKLQGPTRLAYERLKVVEPHVLKAGEELEQALQHFPPTGILIDAICGTGLQQPVRAPLANLIRQINRRQLRVIACDLPTGIDANSGHILGEACMAEQTIALAMSKRGHWLYPGAHHTGRLSIVDIGMPESLAKHVGQRPSHQWIAPKDGANLLPQRLPNTHKGQLGRVGIVAGSDNMPGAGRLACQAALQSGVGIVDWYVDPSMRHAAAHIPPEIILHFSLDNHNLHDGSWCHPSTSALLVGPGIGLDHRAKQIVRTLFTTTHLPTCVDADALTLMAQHPEYWHQIHEATVITPHPKELARCLGMTTEQIQKDRFGAVQAFTSQRKCWVVLKGAHTIIGRSDGACIVIDAGNPGMATAGSGDVLAGLIAGMIAQSMPFEHAVVAATLLHSYAADLALKQLQSQAALSASYLAEHLATALGQWQR